jgi:hypothetical protein
MNELMRGKDLFRKHFTMTQRFQTSHGRAVGVFKKKSLNYVDEKKA